MRTPIPPSLLISLVLLPLGGAAEVYKWVDESGTVHFSQDRNTLPKEAGRPGPASHPVEVFEFEGHDQDAQPPAEGSYTIYMRAAGAGNHIVHVQLNGRVTVPMLLDTGASDVVITRDTARRLGLDGPAGTQSYATANGVVTQRVITLREVALGGATAQMVRGSISDTMQIGLLGTSFLKHFEYSIKGTELVLTPR